MVSRIYVQKYYYWYLRIIIINVTLSIKYSGLLGNVCQNMMKVHLGVPFVQKNFSQKMRLKDTT